MKFFTSASAFALVASLASSVSAVVIPGADTPLFYFVSTSADSSANLLVSLPSAICPLEKFNNIFNSLFESTAAPAGTLHSQAVDPLGNSFSTKGSWWPQTLP